MLLKNLLKMEPERVEMKNNYINLIDYSLLAEALQFYCNKGYKYIEVPWFVDSNISHVTKPTECHDIVISDNKEEHCLVASAEQSLLQLAKENKIYYGHN